MTLNQLLHVCKTKGVTVTQSGKLFSVRKGNVTYQTTSIQKIGQWVDWLTATPQEENTK